MSAHDITIMRTPYFSTGTVYFAKCSCGKYQSGKHASPGHAERASADHVEAKTGTRPTSFRYEDS